MAQMQFRSDDTEAWPYAFGSGSDGALSVSSDATDAPIDSACSGTAGTTSLTATNASFTTGQLILIHQTRGTGAGTWELNNIASYTAGTITTSHSLKNTYTNSGASVAQVLVMKQYTDATIDSGKTLTAKAWNGTVGGIIAFFANGTTTITGTIQLSGKGFRGTASNQYAGEGSAGAATQKQTANGNGGGGAYSDNAGGGGGGNGTAGTTGGQGQSGSSGGAGGEAFGNAALTTGTFGGAGGAAYGITSGNGGGFILIISKTISISGAITNGGANGGAGQYVGAGAGAGGSVLLKGKNLTLGTNKITAAGGTGGDPTSSETYRNGGNGAVGRIHAEYSVSLSGTTTPTIDSTQDATITESSFIPKFIFF